MPTSHLTFYESEELQMNKLSAGFARVNITPMMGIGVVGYFVPRFADGVLDELYVNALAVASGDDKAVLLALDHCGICRDVALDFTASISEATGLPAESIVLHCTHTHTAPPLLDPEMPESLNGDYTSVDPKKEKAYYEMVRSRLCDAAMFALADLKPAKMGYGIGQAPNIAFVRRFRMKDGSVQTNPGVDNPNIDHPIGDVDERVNVLRFDREADSIVLVNFGDHPDVVGGCKISADWPGLTRGVVEKVLDNTKCIVFNGAQGDVNHVNVHPRGGYLNGMFHDFDDVSRGYGHAKYMARVVTGGVLQAFDKVKYVDVENISCIRRTIHVASNMPTAEELVEAEKIHALHEAGKDAELPYSGMMLTTKVAEAGRMVKLQNGPESFPMELSSVAIGPVALIGLPGEPFTGIGRGLKEAEGWELVLPCCLTNGNEGYFPMQDAYDEGGYESQSSFFKAGVAEYLIEEGLKVLNNLRK